MKDNGGSLRVVVVAFIMNLGIALAKFIAFFFTSSGAMLAESLHSLADSCNQIFLYIGLRKAQKAPDARHPFGYGNEEYVWSFMVAIVIFLLGSVFSFYEAIHRFLEPHELEHVEWNLGILGVSMILEGYSSVVAYREIRMKKGSKSLLRYARDSKDQVLITVLFEDYGALMGLTLAFTGSLVYFFTGNPIFDTLATFSIAILLGVICYFLYQEAKSLLVGESASEEDERLIRNAIIGHKHVNELHELYTLHFGANQILVNAHVKFKAGLSVEEVELTIDEIEEEILKHVPAVFRIFIESHRRKTHVR